MARAAGERRGESLSLTGVSKSFSHRDVTVRALRDVDLEVAPGEFVAVVGASGCGKSTLLRIAGGLLEPDSGSARIGAVPARAARTAKSVGLVPQSPSLLPWLSVIENVTLLRELGRSPAARSPAARSPAGRSPAGRSPAVGAPAARSPAEGPSASALLEAVGLGGFDRFRPSQLSGGMRQRVSLVRAFALGAPVLLMDEPFSALDEITREAMQYQLLDIWGATSTTVVFVTHSVAEAVVLADRVVAMAAAPGRVVHEERIALPRPRGESMEFSAEFAEHVRRLRAALRDPVPGGPR